MAIVELQMLLVLVHRDELKRADFTMITICFFVHSHAIVEAFRMKTFSVTLQLKARQKIFQAYQALIILSDHVTNFSVLVELSVADESFSTGFTNLWAFAGMFSVEDTNWLITYIEFEMRCFTLNELSGRSWFSELYRKSIKD